MGRYFVGREDEVRALAHRVGGARSSRTVVEGDAGVGKTSFVNRVKHDLAGHGVRTHEQPIRVTAETTLQSFVGDLLRVLLAMHAARGSEPAGGDAAALWAKVTRVAEGQFLRTGGVRAAEPGLPPELRAADVAQATGLSRPAAGALVARLVAERVLRPTHEDHTGRYHAVAGHVAVALDAALRGPA